MRKFGLEFSLENPRSNYSAKVESDDTIAGMILVRKLPPPPEACTADVLEYTHLRLHSSGQSIEEITDKSFSEIEESIRSKSAELPKGVERYLLMGLKSAIAFEPAGEEFLQQSFKGSSLPESVDGRAEILSRHSREDLNHHLGNAPICLSKWIHDAINVARVDMFLDPEASPILQRTAPGFHETLYELGEFCIGCPIPRD